MKRALVAGLVIAAVPSVARADAIEQDNQLVFGISGTYIPAQHLAASDFLAIGHYVSYSHSLDCVHLGFRLALSIGSGPQYLIDPTAFIGVHFRTGRLAVRLEAGTGPLVNGGDGFSTVVIDHTYVRASAQVRVVKTVIVEAFGGPGFLIGPYAAGVMAEWGIGAGWNF